MDEPPVERTSALGASMPRASGAFCARGLCCVVAWLGGAVESGFARNSSLPEEVSRRFVAELLLACAILARACPDQSGSVA